MVKTYSAKFENWADQTAWNPIWVPTLRESDDSLMEDQDKAVEFVSKKDFDRAISLLKEQGETLGKALGTVRTHAMQTYSKVSAREAAEIEAVIKQTEEFLEECK